MLAFKANWLAKFSMELTVTVARIAGSMAAGFIWLVLALAPPAAAQTVYVSNEKDNTISVIDAAELEVKATMPVGQRPRGIGLSPDGKRLYVCASDDDKIEVVDTATQEIIGSLPSGPDPELFVLHPSGNPLYVANEDDNLVTVVDVARGSVLAEIPVGVEPEGMAISHDGKVLVNTSETSNMAHFFNAETYENIGNVLVGSRPRFAQFSQDDSQVWVSSEIGGTVSVIDAATREIMHIIKFEIPAVPRDAIQPVGLRLTADGKLAFVALGPANRVAVVDAKTYEVLKYLLVGQRVWQLAFNGDESVLFTTNGVSNDISAIDVKDLKVIKSVAVGRYPWGVAGKELNVARVRIFAVDHSLAPAAGRQACERPFCPRPRLSVSTGQRSGTSCLLGLRRP